MHVHFLFSCSFDFFFKDALRVFYDANRQYFELRWNGAYLKHSIFCLLLPYRAAQSSVFQEPNRLPWGNKCMTRSTGETSPSITVENLPEVEVQILLSPRRKMVVCPPLLLIKLHAAHRFFQVFFGCFQPESYGFRWLELWAPGTKRPDMCSWERSKVSGCYQRKNAAGRDCGCENVSRISMETWQMANSRKFKSQSFSHSTSKRHNTG